MENSTDSNWLAKLVTLTGYPNQTKQVLKMIATPDNGSGLLEATLLIYKSVKSAARGDASHLPLVHHLERMYQATKTLVLKYPGLASPKKRELNLPVYGQFCALAKNVDAQQHGSLLESIGWIVIDALRARVTPNERTVTQLTTFARSARRTKLDSDWESLRAMNPLTKQGLEKIAANESGNQAARSLASKLLGAKCLRIGTMKFVEEQPQEISHNNEQSRDVDGSNPFEKDRGRKVRVKRPVLRPSVAGLKVAAAFKSPRDTFGVSNSWDYLSPERLRKTTSALSKDLTTEGNSTRSSMASVALLSLLVNHDFRPTLKLSLTRNDDLWLRIQDGKIYFNLKALLHLKGEPTERDRIPISLPRNLRKYLADRLKQKPDARDVAELLEIVDVDAWLEALAQYVISKGDPAHKSRSARYAHSLALTFIQCGSSPEIAALNTLSLHLAGSSALNYLKVDLKETQALRNKVYAYLGLDAGEDLQEGWVGTARCPTKEEFKAEWVSLGAISSSAFFEISHCTDIEEIKSAFNKGSGAHARAYRLVSGMRMQKASRPTRRDVLSHDSYAYTDDKSTYPLAARLTPKTDQLNAVIAAQLLLLKVTRKRLTLLRVTDSAMPKLLADPPSSAPFFIELAEKIDKRQLAKRLIARPIRITTIKDAHPNSAIHPNAGRYFWASAAVNDSSSLWTERIVLGHGRKLAVVGSFATGESPKSLLQKATAFMQATLNSMNLPSFCGMKSAAVKLDDPQLNLSRQRQLKLSSCKFNPSMPKHYCDQHTLQACVVIDGLRRKMHSSCNTSHNADLLLSLIVMDGITDPFDIKSIWQALQKKSDEEVSGWLFWTRESGQEIALPMQPSTRVHKQRGEIVIELDVAVEQLQSELVAMYPKIEWPSSTQGVLNSLCWMACRWVRLNVAPILVYCFDRSICAATTNRTSRLRLMHGTQDRHVEISSLRDVAAIKVKSGDKLDDLTRVSRLIAPYSGTGSKEGESLKHSKAILKKIENGFDLEACVPIARLLIKWLELECKKWIDETPDPIQVSSMYEYLTRVMDRIRQQPNDPDPRYWSKKEWQKFVAWILSDGNSKEPLKPSVLEQRRISLSRILGQLGVVGEYRIPSDVLPGTFKEGQRVWCDSASRVYVDDQTCGDVRAWIGYVYREWPLQQLQMQVLFDTTLEGCARSGEISAMRLSHLGEQIACVTTSGFSHLKWDGSRRPIQLSEFNFANFKKLREFMESLPKPPEYAFSEDASRVHLTIGRNKQAVLVDLIRTLLGEPSFLFHALRGNGLMRKLVPKGESNLRQYLINGLPIANAEAIVESLAGNDLRHVADCFSASGHASHETPAACYLSLWPYWYAAAMRATQKGQRLKEPVCRLLGDTKYQLLRTDRVRSAERELDEWHWALVPSRAKREIQAESQTEHAIISFDQTACTPISRLLQIQYGTLLLLNINREAAAQVAEVELRHTRLVDERLKFAKEFTELHKRTPGRKDKQGRSKISSLRYFLKPAAKSIFFAMDSCTEEQAKTLSDLLSNECSDVSTNDVELALSALPVDFKLEICWPKKALDKALATELSAYQRVTGIREAKHVTSGIRVRIVPPGDVLNHHATTHMTTFARTALHVRNLLK